jgi:chemotaxis response regulator CheB
MSTEPESPVRTFVLVPEPDLGHAITKKLREDPRVQVCGVSTDPDKDLFRIYEANPDVIVADFEAGGLEFLFSERLPAGKHRVVFFAPRSEAGCDACYEALVHGAQGVMCRPLTAEDVEHCDDLVQSVRAGTPMRPADCPAVKRMQREEGASDEA